MTYIKRLTRFFVTFQRFAIHILRKSFALVPCVVKWNFTIQYFYCCLGDLSTSSILVGLKSTYVDQLNNYLAPVLQSGCRSRFVRCWHAKTDGWATSTFHSNCDGKGPSVTIIQVGDYIFGGYTGASWSSKCHFIAARMGLLQLAVTWYMLEGKLPTRTSKTKKIQIYLDEVALFWMSQ